MDASTWSRIEALFAAALERPAGERRAFLAEACAGELELKAEVEAMLACHDDGGGLRIERLLLDTASHGAHEGQRIGPWRLERLLGLGGMGEVWLAARADGEYEQRAALKLVRPGWRAAQLIPRFRRERQLLARLQHPQIATLLDGGLTADGFPYLAMEFVDGEPVTDWCAARAASLAQRLALFLEICEAVRFAHANLVVHRDLKPANILVTATGRPVLLDFGIATLLDPEDGAPALTREEDRALTPEHAAPEQLRGERATVATDVWALGVLLYELLTGRRPFSGQDCTPLELERRVLSEEPPPPAAVAASREAARALRGDLGRVVLKALDKDPQRRYRSAEDFAADIRHWQRGLPVSATPDALGYRARKFGRRHRTALLVVGLIAGLILAFAVTALWQARLIARERDAAIAARGDSDASVAMLVDLFQMGNPGAVQPGDSLGLDDLLASAERKLEASQESPRVRTKLWRTLAEVHAGRSRLDAQERALKQALAAAMQSEIEADQLGVFHELARLVAHRDGAAAAEPLLRESLRRHQALAGGNEVDVAIAAQDLASVVKDPAEQAELLEQALSIRRRRFTTATLDDSLGLAAALNGLAAAELGARRYAESMAAFREALDLVVAALPPDHPNILAVRSNLAVCLQSAGEFGEAERLHREILDSRRRIFGEGSAWVAASLDNLGVSLANQGRHREAVDYLREALALGRQVYGDGHFSVDAYRNDLAIALVRSGQLEEGFAVFDSTRGAAGGDEHGLAAQRGFAIRRLRLEHACGRPVAIDSLRSAIAALRATRPERPGDLAVALELLGILALETPSRALPGEAAAAFAEALTLGQAEGRSMPQTLAGLRCGRELASAAAGLAVDRRALQEAFAVYSAWGIADPGFVALIARTLAARQGD